MYLERVIDPKTAKLEQLPHELGGGEPAVRCGSSYRVPEFAGHRDRGKDDLVLANHRRVGSTGAGQTRDVHLGDQLQETAVIKRCGTHVALSMLVCSVFLSACSDPPSVEDFQAHVDDEIARAEADAYRRRAECSALEIEFQHHPDVLVWTRRECAQMTAADRTVLADLRARLRR